MVAFRFGQDEMIATSSEDCLIKIWKTGNILKEDNPEPIHTLRKHTGPLFSLASCPNPQNSSEVFLFSGGIEGDIKSWRLNRTEMDWTKSWVNGNEDEQTIWELQAHEDVVQSLPRNC